MVKLLPRYYGSNGGWTGQNQPAVVDYGKDGLIKLKSNLFQNCSAIAGLGLQRDLQETGCITLFVSGTADDTLKSVAVIYNRYDFVSKPVIALDLITKVENALAWTKERDKEAGPLDWPEGLETDPNDRIKLFWKGKRVSLTLTQRSLVDRLARTPGVTVPE